MNRRQFIQNLTIGVAGLYVPKTLYFDMKPKNLVWSEIESLSKCIERHACMIVSNLQHPKILDGRFKIFIDPYIPIEDSPYIVVGRDGLWNVSYNGS